MKTSSAFAARLPKVAEQEKMAIELLQTKLAAGTIVIPWADGHELVRPCAIGDGLRCKVNANIGTSLDGCDFAQEVAKLQAALAAGADAVMDLSTGGDLHAIRCRLREICPVPMGTVPIYEAARLAHERGGSLGGMTATDMLAALRNHVVDGVDFVTVHCGITRRALDALRAAPRLCGVVSRGGSLLARWMQRTGQENPFYEHFDEVMDICHESNVSLSLGDALRPGAIADAGDRPQLEELYTLGELVQRCRAKGVQAMIEGPGHVPLDQIPAQMKLQKKVCDQAPFYVLGPLVTDVAAGYDHIACAIGGALAAMHGANFICYVTPAEHLKLPSAEDVRQGVIAARIAAHAADIANGIAGARAWDDAMSRARKARNWEEMLKLAIDPDAARAARAQHPPQAGDVCSMCGEFCAMRD